MRKRLKKKKKACGMCKPHKRGLANRWKPKEEQALQEWEKRLLADDAPTERSLK